MSYTGVKMTNHLLTRQPSTWTGCISTAKTYGLSNLTRSRKQANLTRKTPYIKRVSYNSCHLSTQKCKQKYFSSREVLHPYSIFDEITWAGSQINSSSLDLLPLAPSRMRFSLSTKLPAPQKHHHNLHMEKWKLKRWKGSNRSRHGLGGSRSQ